MPLKKHLVFMWLLRKRQEQGLQTTENNEFTFVNNLFSGFA